MKNICTLLLLFSISVTAFSKDTVSGRKKIMNHNRAVIYGIDKDNYIRIPPPESMMLKSASSSMIEVTYHDFPQQAQTAFQFAVDIWAGLINSTQTIYVDAYWKALGTGVLGSCGSTDYVTGYDGMPSAEIWYPIALAEKLAQEDINDAGEPDMVASFSSNTNWYYGTDGNTPSGKYDLVSVVLHEFTHGLGFIGSFSVEAGIGSWGWGTDYPISFDSFIEDANGRKLINQEVYPNNSATLKKALAGSAAFFNGEYLMGTTGKKATLYTPSVWDDGSSVYHLNTSYSNGVDMLMTPFINTQSSIHNPGLIALGILGDIGWKVIEINHEPIVNNETISNVEIAVKFAPDFTTSLVEPILHYSLDSAEYVEVVMESDFKKKFNCTATIPLSKSANVSYYITVKDTYGRQFKKPVTAPEENYHFYYGPDTESPAIKHYANTFLLPGQDSLVLTANINDDFGVDTAWVEYKFNNQTSVELGMIRGEKDKFELEIDLSKYGLQINDSIEYRVLAKDKSIAGNIGSYPEVGYVKMKVEAIPEFVESLDLAFENIGSEFLLQGFQIDVPTGFTSGALSTKHPYEFAGDNSTLDYIAQIRYPVKIADESPLISFDEIVMVEPGEPGTKYGDDEFWDYVIVEGSKDEGKTWIPFEDGWDSRRESQWETIYNQSIKTQFSQAIGTPSLYVNHVIDMTASKVFKTGDEVLIRFRLFSDPFAYGWGWAIDNLKIQTKGVGVNNYSLVDGLSVYPNPTSDHTVNFKSMQRNTPMDVALFDVQGKQIANYENVDTNGSITLPSQLKGVFVLVAKNGVNSTHFKLVVR